MKFKIINNLKENVFHPRNVSDKQYFSQKNLYHAIDHIMNLNAFYEVVYLFLKEFFSFRI